MCEHCKVAYSFVFGVQYHRTDCPVVLATKEQELVTRRRETFTNEETACYGDSQS